MQPVLCDPGSDPARLNALHRATYDRVAATYAVANAALPPAVAASAAEFVARLGGAGRVLDLGCGHGRDAAWLRGQGLSVVGADLSSGMLLEAQSQVPDGLVQLDMRRLAFGDGVFAGVWSNAALIHIPAREMPPLLAGVHRVLVPGGWLFASFQVGGGEVWEDRAYGFAARRFFTRYDAEDIADLLRAAHFCVSACDAGAGGPSRQWVHFFAQA